VFYFNALDSAGAKTALIPKFPQKEIPHFITNGDMNGFAFILVNGILVNGRVTGFVAWPVWGFRVVCYCLAMLAIGGVQK
jgi:hypothetical protein